MDHTTRLSMQQKCMVRRHNVAHSLIREICIIANLQASSNSPFSPILCRISLGVSNTKWGGSTREVSRKPRTTSRKTSFGATFMCTSIFDTTTAVYKPKYNSDKSSSERRSGLHASRSNSKCAEREEPKSLHR